jgi:hypothetical protein
MHCHDDAVLELGFVGDIEHEDALVVVAWLEHALAQARCRALFFDVEGLRSYATALRTGITDLLLQRRDRWSCVHTLAGSKVVRMGISVAAIVLGAAVKPHSNRASFDHQLALARAR